MEITKKQIRDARMALAKLANTEFPSPVLDLIAPTLDACDPIIGEIMKLEDGEEAEKILAEVVAIPACVCPSLPQIKMTYLERRSLRGMVDFEEVL